MKLGKRRSNKCTLAVARWCWCNAACTCRGTAGTASFDTIQALGDMSTA